MHPILNLLERADRELSENVYFYPPPPPPVCSFWAMAFLRHVATTQKGPLSNRFFDMLRRS